MGGGSGGSGTQAAQMIVGVTVGLPTVGEVTRVPVIVSAVNDGVDVEEVTRVAVIAEAVNDGVDVEEVTRVPVIAEAMNDGMDVVELTLQSNGTKRKKITCY